MLFHRNNSPQNPCLKSDTLYWLQVNQSLFFFFIWSFVLSRHFFVCLYLYCHCRSNYQEGRGWWSHSSVYCLMHVCTSPKPGTGFPSTYVVVFFSIIWKEMCLFCWYWWILFPYNFSFNKYQFYSVRFVPKKGSNSWYTTLKMCTLTLYTPLSQFLYTVVAS